MKLLTRYLFKEIFHYFWLFIAIFVVVLLVYKTYDTSQDIFQYNPKLIHVLLLLLFGVPVQLAQTFPMICLMSTIFAYGLLAKNRELLAMVSVGISFRKLALPPLAFGLGMSLFAFWFSETVVPYSVSQENSIFNLWKGKTLSLTNRRNLMIKGADNRFYYVRYYNTLKQEMVYPTLLTLNPDGGGIAERIDAERGRLVNRGDEITWEFTGAERWRFNPDGALAKGGYEKFKVPYAVKLEESLTKLLTKAKKPAEMNFAELWEFIGLMRETGAMNLGDYAISLQQKLTFPLACLMMTLLGYAVVANVHARRFARGVFTGLLVAIGFYIVNAFLINMGKKGAIPPIVAGWGAIVLFLTIVTAMMSRLHKIRG